MGDTGHVECLDERLVMAQMATQKVLTVVACVLMLCLSVPTLTVADQAQYIYDDLSRLSQVIDGSGNVVTYHYDAVGNLLSITHNTGGVGVPTITALMPNSGNVGASVSVSITAMFKIFFAVHAGGTAVTVTTTMGSGRGFFDRALLLTASDDLT